MKVTASLTVLMGLAKDVGNAKKSGNAENVKTAEKDLKDYEQVCLDADEIRTDIPGLFLL